jgi:uncharacterized protein (DUF488 family)
MTTVFTLGHSDRSLEQVMDLLRGAGINTLVDVRAQPHSRRHPQFEESSLRSAAEAAGMTYHWAGRQLGGRRPLAPTSRHKALEEGLRGYADYMETQAFQRAAAQLIGLAGRGATAILCAEREPERCHRSLIADYLILQGIAVVHLMSAGESREHQLRPEARRESAELVYDRQVTGSLELE